MKSRPHYTTRDLTQALTRLGLASGEIAYVTGNLGSLGFHDSFHKQRTLEAHLEALQDVLGSTGTAVVPTHSFSLCNTDRVFDACSTPSERGAWTEHLRSQPGSVRQFHPFASVTALGAKSEELCGRSTRHAYGPGTPFDRMIQRNAWFVSIGLPPQHTCSIVHHVEMLMGVPYRYTKEYLQPVMRDGGVKTEPFYQFVTYRESDLVRDRNEKIFQHPLLQQSLRNTKVGLNDLWAYRMQDFQTAAMDCMTEDIYAWLKRPPECRPFQK
ncbi:MAG TPA: AAC(3) family N-acetyltransferase [Prosthecobacter sp.]